MPYVPVVQFRNFKLTEEEKELSSALKLTPKTALAPVLNTRTTEIKHDL
jgi:hypothetical protein